MKQKLFFFDIDGTLIPEDTEYTPSPAVSDALTALRRAGHKIFLCTGRTLCDLNEGLLNIGFDGIVAGAGAYINVDGRCVYHSPIPIPLLRETVDRMIDCHISGVLSGPVELYYAGVGTRRLPWKLPRLKSGRELTGSEEIEKLSARVTTPDEFEPLRSYLEQYYEIYAGDEGRYYEIVRKGQDKAHALRWLCQYFDIPQEDTVAFGDSMNDLALLCAAGTGVAMENAPEEVKHAAALVTDIVEQDGVVKGLQHLGYL